MWRVALLVICACDAGTPPIERLPPPPPEPIREIQPPPPRPPPASGWDDATVWDATRCSDDGEIEYGAIVHGHVRFCTTKTCWDVDEHGVYSVKVGTAAMNRAPLHDAEGDLQFTGKAALYTNAPISKAMKTAGVGGLLVAGEDRVFAIRRDHSMDELDKSSRVLRSFQQECEPPITAWHDEPIVDKIAAPSCPRHADRYVHYAALVDGDVHFCVAWDGETQCWTVDVATGHYTRVRGVAIASRFPMPDGNGDTRAHIGRTTVLLDQHELHYENAQPVGIEVPGDGGVLIGDGKTAYVIDRDGVISEIAPLPSSTFVRTLHPPACSAN